jgi:hypothetical protein
MALAPPSVSTFAAAHTRVDAGYPAIGSDGGIVCVHGPLKKLAGGAAEHPVDGATIGDLLRALERDHPRVGLGSDDEA